MEIDFEKNMNKPNLDFVILDAFGQCKGLECFHGCQGMCLNPQTLLKQTGSMAASCFKCTVFLSLNRVSPANFSTLIHVACVVYI